MPATLPVSRDLFKNQSQYQAAFGYLYLHFIVRTEHSNCRHKTIKRLFGGVSYMSSMNYTSSTAAIPGPEPNPSFYFLPREGVGIVTGWSSLPPTGLLAK